MDAVSLHLERSKTDWINQGTVRTSGRRDARSPYVSIFDVVKLVNLYRISPGRFVRNIHLLFASLGNDRLLTAFQLTKVVKSAVGENGLDPEKYGMSPFRSGGPAALYRADGDLDLTARFGGWKGRSIHGYFWDSHRILVGIAALITRSDGPIVQRAAEKPHFRTA